MSRKKYGREFFDKHFDYLVDGMKNKVPIRVMADALSIRHITLANMCHRYGLSANVIRYNHNKEIK
ncbi:hypothetical protein JLT2_65 [Paraglaciecola Antarctic JLT virus 2]|nr:hypothetical protein JLT2_65 [Paraglaciecola Antarctic JLT virus 2]